MMAQSFQPVRMSLIRDGYDPYIDFLKGICIIFVVLTHSLPEHIRDASLFVLWGKSAVPVFLMLQVFHACKKGLGAITTDYTKLWHRIIKPFLVMEGLILIFAFLLAKEKKVFLDDVLLSVGWGPGSYFPWVYVQFAIFLPLFVPVFKLLKGLWLAAFFVALSEVVELTCSLTHVPDWLYRILFLRYVFLFYLGFLLAVDKCKLNCSTFVLSCISMASVLFFAYAKVDLFPPPVF